jgi:hypothetical protein
LSPALIAEQVGEGAMRCSPGQLPHLVNDQNPRIAALGLRSASAHRLQRGAGFAPQRFGVGLLGWTMITKPSA